MAGSTWKISTIRRMSIFHSLDARCTGLDVEITYEVPGLDDIILPAYGSVVITAPNVFTTCSVFPVEETTGTDGAIPDFTPPTLPSVEGGLDPFVYGEVYNRIWCVPHFMRPQNPELDTDIPFIVWNAYPVPAINTMNTIGGSGHTGLTLDLIAPRDFNAIEELEVNLQISSTAPTEISATYIFTFDYGTDTFLFETSIADWIEDLPEMPISETWQWLSNVIGSWDSTEQRISVRRQPRRRIEYTLLLKDYEDRQRAYSRWYERLLRPVVIPLHQYSTRITQDSIVTATKIYFNPNRTDMRDSEFVIIYRPSTEESFLLRLDEVEVDGATLATPLTMEIYTRDIVAPAFEGRLDNLTGPQMTSVSGDLVVKAWLTGFRSSFDRPESTVVITEFDGLMVLDKRPLARNSAAEMFDINPTMIDTGSGSHERRSSWLHALILGIRQFNIQRRRYPEEMDYWRDFLTACTGMRESFLLPTWRRDLFLATIPNPGDYLLSIEGAIYGSQYWPYDTYKRLQFWNSAGDIIYRKVIAVTDQPGGTTLLTLEDPLPLDFNWQEDFTISFLNKVRLASDEVQLNHFEMHTTLELAIRTTDQ